MDPKVTQELPLDQGTGEYFCQSIHFLARGSLGTLSSMFIICFARGFNLAIILLTNFTVTLDSSSAFSINSNHLSE